MPIKPNIKSYVQIKRENHTIDVIKHFMYTFTAKKIFRIISYTHTLKDDCYRKNQNQISKAMYK